MKLVSYFSCRSGVFAEKNSKKHYDLLYDYTKNSRYRQWLRLKSQAITLTSRLKKLKMWEWQPPEATGQSLWISVNSTWLLSDNILGLLTTLKLWKKKKKKTFPNTSTIIWREFDEGFWVVTLLLFTTVNKYEGITCKALTYIILCSPHSGVWCGESINESSVLLLGREYWVPATPVISWCSLSSYICAWSFWNHLPS